MQLYHAWLIWLSSSQKANNSPTDRPSVLQRIVWPKIEAGEVKPRVFKTFPLERTEDAHRLMESATHFGKIILEP